MHHCRNPDSRAKSCMHRRSIAWRNLPGRADRSAGVAAPAPPGRNNTHPARPLAPLPRGAPRRRPRSPRRCRTGRSRWRRTRTGPPSWRSRSRSAPCARRGRRTRCFSRHSWLQNATSPLHGTAQTNRIQLSCHVMLHYIIRIQGEKNKLFQPRGG
uniref:Uncharacterized protein n=1 Tax=Zea mays TaxID=4577 RepID=B7ZZC8_MAIZE|nr:unknown [Zea mays]